MAGLVDYAEAIVSIAVPLGTAGAFIWNKTEKRFKHIEGLLEECHEREVVSKERQGTWLAVVELLWQEVKHHDPESPILKRAKKLMDDLRHQMSGGRPGSDAP